MTAADLDTNTLDELLAGFGVRVDDDPADEWLIPDFINPSLTAITGAPERGKTTMLCSMVGSLLDGTSWAGRPTGLPEEKRILFGCEDGPSVRRVRRMFPDACASGRLIVVRLSPWNGGRPRLSREGIIRLNVGLVIVDSVFRAVGDTNDQALASPFINGLCDFDVPVIVVHHFSKGGTTPSGAQAYVAGYRHTIAVTGFSADFAAGTIRQSLKLSGNDIETSTVTVETNRSTGAVVAVDRDGASEGGKRLRAPVATQVQKAGAIGAHLADLGIDPTTKSANALARLLAPTDIPGAGRLSHETLRKDYFGNQLAAVYEGYRAAVLAA